MPGLKYNQDSVLKRRVLIGNFKERDTFWCEYLKMEHQEDHLRAALIRSGDSVIIKMRDFPHGNKRGGTADKRLFIRPLYR